MIIWWHHVEMTSWSYDIIFRGLFSMYTIPLGHLWWSWKKWYHDEMTWWHSLQSCCHPYWVPKSSFACGEQSMWNWQWLCEWLTCSNRAMIIDQNYLMIKHIGNNLKVVFTHTWPCWGNPVTQDWHCQPEKGKCQHLIRDNLIFDLKCFWLSTI